MNKVQGIAGAVIMAVGGFCPLLRVPIMGNWNYYEIDQRLAIAFYVLVLVGLAGAFLDRPKVMKFAGWATVVLVLISLLGIYLKVHDTFGFIRFKKLIDFAAGSVKYKWGWWVILAGAALLILVRKPKPVATVND